MKRYIFDTNILLLYIRKNPSILTLADDYLREGEVAIRVASQAEILSIAKQNNWGSQKLKKLNQLINELVIIPIQQQDLIDCYAEIDAYSQGAIEKNGQALKTSARNMGKNDIWIAATANITNATLITTDKDFNHLDKVFFDLNFIEI